MRSIGALLLCLVMLVGRAVAQDPPDSTLVDCGTEKVAVFEGSVSPDGRYAFGWTFRPARNRAPVDWATYNPDHPNDWLQAYLPEPDATDPAYQLVNGILDLHTHQFTPLASRFPYWPNKNHGDMGVAWSHGSQPGKFAVIHNDARFYTIDLWLIDTGGASLRVVDLIDPAEKSVRRFLRQDWPDKYRSFALTYADVSFKPGVATIDFSADLPKSEDNSGTQGTVRVALPAGTITGVKDR